MVFTSDRPIFLQLADQLADEILRGRYAAGEQVPSTNELAAFHRINPATAGKALNLLVDDQILEKRRGLGMFVTDGAVERLRQSRTGGFVEHFITPLLTEARSLGLSTDDVVQLIRVESNTALEQQENS